MKQPLIMYGLEITDYSLQPVFDKMYAGREDGNFMFMQKVQNLIKKDYSELDLVFTSDKRIFLGLTPRFPWEEQVDCDDIEIGKIIFSCLQRFFEDINYEDVLENCIFVKECVELVE